MRSPLGAVRRWALAGVSVTVVVGATTADAGADGRTSRGYRFVEIADSVADGFDPNNVGCAAINDDNQVAFRWGRVAEDGFNTVDGIYLADPDGRRLRTIAEDEDRFQFIGVNPSLNDRGQVSFAASLESDGEAILRGHGGRLTTIATTEPGQFNFFGFDTSINDDGRVAFKAELDEDFDFDEGLFSGRGGRITTHYLASTSEFDGNDSRPSINNRNDIAFEESVDFQNGVFVTDGDGFTTISAPGTDLSGVPILNDQGLAAFRVGFFDEARQEFVEAIVTGDGAPLATVADTTGEFDSFGFRPPALNNRGDVAFLAFIGGFTASGIFVGPHPVDDRVIATGDTIDGATVLDLGFCEEGLNDRGQLTFRVMLDDPSAPDGFRIAFYRAMPRQSHG
jgi:hypothetical protein